MDADNDDTSPSMTTGMLASHLPSTIANLVLIFAIHGQLDSYRLFPSAHFV